MTTDQATADEAIAGFEQSLRYDGFAATAGRDDDDLTFESEECRDFDETLPGVDRDLPGETASAHSSDFERGELVPAGGVQETVQAFVGFVEKADDLDPVLVLLNDERFGRCLEEAFRVGIEGATADDRATTEVGDVEIEQLGSVGLGDTTGGVQLTGQFATLGLTFPFSFALQVVRVDRALVGIFASTVGSNEPTAYRSTLLQVLVDGVRDQSS